MRPAPPCQRDGLGLCIGGCPTPIGRWVLPSLPGTVATLPAGRVGRGFFCMIKAGRGLQIKNAVLYRGSRVIGGRSSVVLHLNDFARRERQWLESTGRQQVCILNADSALALDDQLRLNGQHHPALKTRVGAAL
jgi:hypothetical protein